ncbi:MAG: ABC transporter permease subunit [Planctomycetes bacterium]|nr:ABC transporter permease subunit [Planctomycetota bacterium]
MAEPATNTRRSSPTRDALRLFFRNKPAVVSLVMISLLVLIALAGEIFTGKPPTPEESEVIRQTQELGDRVRMSRNPRSIVDPLKTELKDKLERPYLQTLAGGIFGGFAEDKPEFIQGVYAENMRLSGAPESEIRKLSDDDIRERRKEGLSADGARAYWLGTDHLGRDVFARLWAGTTISLTVGLLVVGISVLIGISLGGIAGFFGRSRVGLPFLLMVLCGLAALVARAVDAPALVVPLVTVALVCLVLQLFAAVIGREYRAVVFVLGVLLVTGGVQFYVDSVERSTPEGRLLVQSSRAEEQAYQALIETRDLGTEVKKIENKEAGAIGEAERLARHYALEVAYARLEFEHQRFKLTKYRSDRDVALRLCGEEKERGELMKSKGRDAPAAALLAGAEKRRRMLEATEEEIKQRLSEVDKAMDEAVAELEKARVLVSTDTVARLAALREARLKVAQAGLGTTMLVRRDRELEKKFEEDFAKGLAGSTDPADKDRIKAAMGRAGALGRLLAEAEAQADWSPMMKEREEARALVKAVEENDPALLLRSHAWLNLSNAQDKPVRGEVALLQGSNAMLERRAAMRSEYHTTYSTQTRNSREGLLKAELLSGWERYPIYAKLRHFMTPVMLGLLMLVSVLLLAGAAQRAVGESKSILRKVFVPTLTVDDMVMRFTEVMMTIPTLILIIAILALFSRDVYIVMAVLGLTGWMGTTRFVRAEILSLREQDFIQAARALGVSDIRIIWRHLVPNAISPVLVSATLGVASAILLESTLSFLGLGATADQPTWGSILSEGRSYINDAGWLMLIPALAILVTVLSFNLLGEGLREAFNPKLRGR